MDLEGEVAEDWSNNQRGSDVADKNGHTYAVASPLEEDPIRGWGIKGIYVY